MTQLTDPMTEYLHHLQSLIKQFTTLTSEAAMLNHEIQTLIDRIQTDEQLKNSTPH